VLLRWREFEEVVEIATASTVGLRIWTHVIENARSEAGATGEVRAK